MRLAAELQMLVIGVLGSVAIVMSYMSAAGF